MFNENTLIEAQDVNQMGLWFPPGSQEKRCILINLSKMAHELTLYWRWLWSLNDFSRKLKWKVRLFTLIALRGQVTTGNMLQSTSMWEKQREEKETKKRGWRWPVINRIFLIALSFLKGLWITQRVGNDDSHVKPQKIWFSMNKITRRIHTGKNNTFAHKCEALIVVVHSEAASLSESPHETTHCTVCRYCIICTNHFGLSRTYLHKAE